MINNLKTTLKKIKVVNYLEIKDGNIFINNDIHTHSFMVAMG
mgnify:CR=1 FL=1